MEFDKKVDERIKKVVPNYLKSSAFTARKVTDDPTDSLQVVNRKFVTLNGSSSQRPRGSVIGQMYFDTSLGANGKPIWWNGSGFVDSGGNFV